MEIRSNSATAARIRLRRIPSSARRLTRRPTKLTYRYQEGDVLYPDPELSFKTKLADLPLIVQEMIFSNKIDDNGVLIRTANDKPGYFAVGFMSEKANGTYRYVWLFKVRAKPVTETYATKEGTSITRQTGEVEWTAIKRTSDGRYQAVADEGENGVRPDRVLLTVA